MKISVDAGALCGGTRHQFGTYVVTQNILRCLAAHKEHDYTAYLYRRISKETERFPPVRYKVMRPALGWMAARVSIEQLIRPSDVFLGLNQAIPWYTRARVITLLHGLSFFFHKELYRDSYEALKDQVLFAISRSDVVLVPSVRVKTELSDHFGFNDAVVNSFGIPYDMHMESVKKPSRARPYFIFVGMNHPIKNISFLVDAFTVYKSDPRYKDFELLLIGNHGNREHESLGIRSLQASRDQLPDLYRNAVGYLTASHYESFNLPVLEALSTNTPVIGKSTAIIQELKPSVTIADKLEDFVDAMKAVTERDNKRRNTDLKERFSWKKFTDRVVASY